MVKMSRRQLREMILEQVAQDQAPEGESKEKAKPTSRVYNYLKQRAEKIDHRGARLVGQVIADEYMQGKISKDEAMEALIEMEKGIRGRGGILDLVKKFLT